MSRVLLLATTTGYQTRAFEEAAARLGIDLVYATDRCHTLDDPWQDQAIPIRFHQADVSVAAIVEAARAKAFDGLLAVGDRPTLIAAQAAQALGLPWHSPEADRGIGLGPARFVAGRRHLRFQKPGCGQNSAPPTGLQAFFEFRLSDLALLPS